MIPHNHKFDAFIMAHKLAYIENLKTEYAERLKICLGKRLTSAQRRWYKYDDYDVTPPDDTAEVVLDFEGLSSLYFSWVQFADEFDLSLSDKSWLRDGGFSDTQAEDDDILSNSVSKVFTSFELYEDEFGSTLAALLNFEEDSLVVAIGHSEPPNLDAQMDEFLNFYGDDFYLWTKTEFKAALQKHELKVAVRVENKKSV